MPGVLAWIAKSFFADGYIRTSVLICHEHDSTVPQISPFSDSIIHLVKIQAHDCGERLDFCVLGQLRNGGLPHIKKLAT
jgi:hypothetical protein